MDAPKNGSTNLSKTFEIDPWVRSCSMYGPPACGMVSDDPVAASSGDFVPFLQFVRGYRGRMEDCPVLDGLQHRRSSGRDFYSRYYGIRRVSDYHMTLMLPPTHEGAALYAKYFNIYNFSRKTRKHQDEKRVHSEKAANYAQNDSAYSRSCVFCLVRTAKLQAAAMTANIKLSAHKGA